MYVTNSVYSKGGLSQQHHWTETCLYRENFDRDAPSQTQPVLERDPMKRYYPKQTSPDRNPNPPQHTPLYTGTSCPTNKKRPRQKTTCTDTPPDRHSPRQRLPETETVTPLNRLPLIQTPCALQTCP